MCEAEVELGKRLAPHVHRAAHPIVHDGEGLSLASVGDARARIRRRDDVVRTGRDATRRRSPPTRVSDATEDIVVARAATPDVFDDVAPARHLMLRTDRDPAAIECDLDALLDASLGPLRG